MPGINYTKVIHDTYTYIHIPIYTHIYAHTIPGTNYTTYIHIQTHTYIYLYVLTYIRIGYQRHKFTLHAYAYTHIHTHTHTYLCALTYIHIRIQYHTNYTPYIRIHTPPPTPLPPLPPLPPPPKFSAVVGLDGIQCAQLLLKNALKVSVVLF